MVSTFPMLRSLCQLEGHKDSLCFLLEASYTVLTFMFRSWINLYEWCEVRIKMFLSTTYHLHGYSDVLAPFVKKDFPVTIELLSGLCRKVSQLYIGSPVSGLLLFCCINVFVLKPIPQLAWLLWFCNKFEIMQYKFSVLVFNFQDCFFSSGSFVFPYTF